MASCSAHSSHSISTIHQQILKRNWKCWVFQGAGCCTFPAPSRAIWWRGGHGSLLSQLAKVSVQRRRCNTQRFCSLQLTA